MANRNDSIADQLQKKLIARLMNISNRASLRRHLDNSISGSYADELKARAFMFQEAADLVATLPATGSALVFFRAVSGAVAHKTDENDWGWGSSWSNFIHAAVVREIQDEIIGFIEKRG